MDGIILDCMYRVCANMAMVVSGIKVKFQDGRGLLDLDVVPTAEGAEHLGLRPQSSHRGIQLRRKWLNECDTSHTNCAMVAMEDLPTRLIDVGSEDENIEPRLVITQGSRGTYRALSHCWGTVMPITTTKANMSLHMSALPLRDLPNTF
jgi:hypothetical protein